MRATPVLFALALISPAVSLADAAPAAANPTVPHSLTDEGEVAYLKSSGSSDQETFKGYTYTRYQRNLWTYELRLEGLNESDSSTGQRTRERYFVLNKTSWNFTPKDYLFLKPQYEKDLQSAYEYQALLAAGYGHQFFKTDTLFLNADLGAGTRFNKLNVTGDKDSEAVGNLATKFAWKFSTDGRLTEDASLDAGESGTVVRTRSAVEFALTELFGLSVAYETKYDDGPVTVRDTLLSVGLNYHVK